MRRGSLQGELGWFRPERIVKWGPGWGWFETKGLGKSQ